MGLLEARKGILGFQDGGPYDSRYNFYDRRTNYFNIDTRKDISPEKVKRYQGFYNNFVGKNNPNELIIDGKWGDNTQKAYEEVINTQKMLNNEGYKLKVDGIPGDKTIKAMHVYMDKNFGPLGEVEIKGVRSKS